MDQNNIHSNLSSKIIDFLKDLPWKKIKLLSSLAFVFILSFSTILSARYISTNNQDIRSRAAEITPSSQYSIDSIQNNKQKIDTSVLSKQIVSRLGPPVIATASGFWQSLNGSDIFNTNNGNVGISTQTPGAKIEIHTANNYNGPYFQITRDGMAGNNPVFWISHEASYNIDHLQVNGPIHSYVNADISKDPTKTPYLDLGDQNWSWTTNLEADGSNSTNNSWLSWNWVWGMGEYQQVGKLDKSGFLSLTGGVVLNPVTGNKIPLYINAPSSQSQDIIQANINGVNILKVTNNGFITTTGGISVSNKNPSNVPLYINTPLNQSQDIIQANVNGVKTFSVNKTGFINSSAGISIQNISASLVPLYVNTPKNQAQDVIQVNSAGKSIFKVSNKGYVTAKGYYTGDIIFQKDEKPLWRMYEDENGIYLQNLKTGKKYKIKMEELNSP